MIYLDNSATTKPSQEVLDSFRKVADVYYANPSSIHSFGGDSERLLEHSRKQAAGLLGVQDREVIFTSGGTEGNNLAIKGIAFAHRHRGRHVITTQIEHPSVLEAFHALEEFGFEVTYLSVDRKGRVDVDELRNSIRKDTILVSVMSVNNELGTIQPITDIGALLNEYPKIFFHVDHVQGLGKVDIPYKHIDACTVSGHKIHGLKGTGAVIVKQNVSLWPLFHGGGQEGEARSGTENLPGTVAFVKALRLLLEKQDEHQSKLKILRSYLWERLSELESVFINSPQDGAPHIINFSVPGLRPEVVIHALAEQDIFISTKSACSSKAPDVSAVLKACNLDRDRTVSALRVSLSYLNEKEEVTIFIEALNKVMKQLRSTMR